MTQYEVDIMYEVKLDAFNGPLDLLLHLIQKFEIDIYDIPMQALTEQYMQYVHAMKQLEINIASEYLVLASELLMIKSKMLLPQSTSDMDVDDDPREDLVGRLIEYQNYKEYTAILNDMKEERDFYFTKRPTDLSHLETDESWDPNHTIDLTELIVAYQRVKNRVELNTPKSVEIRKETFTIQQATEQVTSRLKDKDHFNFFSLFTFSEPIEQVVTHFLAILEMSKAGIINIEQQRNFEDINIIRGVNYHLDNHGILESLLFTAGDEGLDEKQLLEILDMSKDQLVELIENYSSHGLMIQRFGTTYVLTTKKEAATYIEQLIEQKSQMKLSQAAMEVLSIIAYNQPLSRSDIELIRSINSDGAVKTLIAKGLVEAKVVNEQRSQQLITTDLFLNVFGISNIEDLPTTEEDDEEMDAFFSNLVNQKGENND